MSNTHTRKTDLTIFNFETHAIRIVTDQDGTPWFVAKDVAEALGFKDTVNAIKTHCRGVAKYHPLQTEGGVQNLRVIQEPDLYRMATGSALPSAVELERKVFEDILPTLRKTGAYHLDQAIPLNKRQRAQVAKAQDGERLAKEYERRARKEAEQHQRHLKHMGALWLAAFPGDALLIHHWEQGMTLRECVRMHAHLLPRRATLERFRLLRQVGLIDDIENLAARNLAAMGRERRLRSPITYRPFSLPTTH